MASSIVTSAVQKLEESLADEAKYLYQVSDKMKSLQAELEQMLCFLEDADNREHQEKTVYKWVSEIRDIAYDAEDVVETYLHRVSHHRENAILNTMRWFSCCISDVIALHFVGSSIDESRARITDLIPKMQTYGIRSIGSSEGSKNIIDVKEQRRTYSHTKEAPIGLEEHVRVLLVQLLENKDVSVIGITGTGGSGKTTLAGTVFSNRAIEEHFQKRCAWVYLSKEFGKRRVFEEILIGLCANEDEHIRKKVRELGDDELPMKIREVLRANECLLIIDDIWYTHSWDSLKPAFRSIKSSSSKILITTRNESLVHYADEDGYSHHSSALSDDDSWRLLERKAFSKRGKEDVDDVTAKMEKLGREMVKHCNGLPLAIMALGGILSARKTVEEWEIVQKNMSLYLMFDTTEGNVHDGVSQVLELSYYDLPFHLKPCFLYLGSFPEDSEIQSQRLYHLWEAEGLVSRVNNRVEFEGIPLDDIAESYLNQLVQRSVVQIYKRWPNGSIKSCRVHDIMRDMCLQKSKDVNLDQQLEKSAKIRSLLIFPFEDASFKQLSQGMNKFFSRIRILDLQGTSIRELPRAIKNCVHMRYLNLRGTHLDIVPKWILHIEYLETLDLRISSSVKVYSDFRKLKRVRHLYLPRLMCLEGSERAKFNDDQLQRMETLKNFDLRKCRMEDFAKMVNLKIFSFQEDSTCLNKESFELLLKSPLISSGRLINHLSMIRIKAEETMNEKPTVMMTVGTYLKGLSIEGRIEVGDAKVFHHNLKTSELWDCEIGEAHLAELEKLPHLESLSLHSKAVKGSKMSFSEKAFPQLLKLYLYHMKELEEWEVGDNALPNLRRLYIVQCPKLKKLPHHLPRTVQIICRV